MILRTSILTLLLWGLNYSADGQNTTTEYLDSLVTNFSSILKVDGVDTICIYENYLVGSIPIIGQEEDQCDYKYIYVPTYIIWKKIGRTFLSKKDNCFDYSTVEIMADSMWDYFFTNRKLISIEKVKPFQCYYYEKNKRRIVDLIVDHSGHENFKIIVGADTIEVRIDCFALQPNNDTDKKTINLNYKHNLNLKSKHLVDELNKIIWMVEDNKLLTKSRR
jgi:hypothetical protein